MHGALENFCINGLDRCRLWHYVILHPCGAPPFACASQFGGVPGSEGNVVVEGWVEGCCSPAPFAPVCAELAGRG